MHPTQPKDLNALNALNALNDPRDPSQPSGLEPDEAAELSGIALVSIALRVPGASGLDEVWTTHVTGRETIRALADDELRAAGVADREFGDPRYVKARGVLEGIELFDPAFFGFTPREAELLDPQHRLLLEAAWEALELAGVDPARAAARGLRIGVFVGSGASSYMLSNLLPNADVLQATGWLQASVLNDRDFLASRLAYKLDLRGPSVVVQSACSTSLLAVHLACQSLLAGECDLALAGGSSISVPQIEGYLFEPGGISSSDGHCRPFDERADGTVLGSGVGVAVLERADRAAAAGRPVRAIVRGTATGNDGAARVGFTAPGVDGQAQAIAEALALAGVSAADVPYVETHGSGTALGDPIELSALARVFEADGARPGSTALGSAKANHGHLNAAAGIAGLARAALALEHQTIPPMLHFERPTPRFDLAASPFTVPATARPWPAGRPRLAGVSSFGLGGTNVHAVLEGVPARTPSPPSRRAVQPLLLSARSGAALGAAAERLAQHLEARPGLEPGDLADVAWTLAAGRHRFERRAAVVARSREEAVARLRAGAIERIAATAPRGGRPVVFLFPGLGDQYPGMCRGLYDGEPDFKAELDAVAEALRPSLGRDLREILFAGDAPRPSEAGKLDMRAMLRRGGEDPAGALAPTEIAQPVLFAVEVALARTLMRWGIRPAAMIGYSLGEYAAACASGALPLPVAARLVAARAQAIAELPPGAMLAVPLPEAETRGRLAARAETAGLSIAARNGAHLTVVAGRPEAVAAFERALAEEGVACLPVSTTHAFHSRELEPLAAKVETLAREALGSPVAGAPEIPFLSNLTGTWITAEDLADPSYWSRHMTGTVRFADALATLGADPRFADPVLLEVGPGGTLGALARQGDRLGGASPVIALATIRRASEGGDDTEILAGALGGLFAHGVEWDPERYWAGEERRFVELPTYPFERERCWIEAPRGAGFAAGVQGVAGRGERSEEAALAPRADLADWFYLPGFRRTLQPSLPTDLAALGPWLLIAERDRDAADPAARLVDRMLERLETAGAAVAVLAPSELAAERLHAIRPRRIVHLGHVGTGGAEDASLAARAAASLADFAALAHGIDRGAVEIVLAGSGMAAVDAGEAVDPARAALPLGLRVLGHELPDAGVRAVDLLAAEVAAAPDAAAGALLAEAAAPRGEPFVAIRGLGPHPATRPIRAAASQEPVRLTEPVALAAGAPVLVTDAATALGAAVALGLAQVGARLALALPAGCPGADAWPAIASGAATSPLLAPAAARHLLAAQAATETAILAGGERAQAGGRAACAALLAAARGRFGRLAGVVHTATASTGGLAALKTAPSLAAALAPEVDGALAWSALLADRDAGEPEAFLALCPSTLGATGGFGQLELAASGAALAAVAASASAAGRTVVAPLWDAYQWGGWLASGLGAMAGASEAEIAAASVPPETSARALLRALSAGVPALVVSARDFDAVVRATDAVTASSLARSAGAAGTSGATAAGGAGRRLETPYVAPRNETEVAIAQVWSELFGIAEIGVHDDFLALGGHSLLAIQVATAVRARLDVELPITAIFDAPTVAGLAELIRGAQDEAPAPEAVDELLRMIEGMSPDQAAERLRALDEVTA